MFTYSGNATLDLLREHKLWWSLISRHFPMNRNLPQLKTGVQFIYIPLVKLYSEIRNCGIDGCRKKRPYIGTSFDNHYRSWKNCVLILRSLFTLWNGCWSKAKIPHRGLVEFEDHSIWAKSIPLGRFLGYFSKSKGAYTEPGPPTGDKIENIWNSHASVSKEKTGVIIISTWYFMHKSSLK